MAKNSDPLIHTLRHHTSGSHNMYVEDLVQTMQALHVLPQSLNSYVL